MGKQTVCPSPPMVQQHFRMFSIECNSKQLSGKFTVLQFPENATTYVFDDFNKSHKQVIITALTMTQNIPDE